MSVALLDVSVLIALFDRGHVRSDEVAAWFADNATAGWSTCAITENGFVRIVSQATYPHPIPTADAISRLNRACAHPSHRFWNCDRSITQPGLLTPGQAIHSSQITDSYLLALAVAHDGCFVTLDRRITPTAVRGARADHLVAL